MAGRQARSAAKSTATPTVDYAKAIKAIQDFLKTYPTDG